MSSLPSPARVIVLFLVPALFSLMLHADPGALPKTEIEQAIRQQLNAAYELREWSHTLVKQTQLGPASISQLALEIVVELKEPLYTRTGQQRDGQYLVRPTRTGVPGTSARPIACAARCGLSHWDPRPPSGNPVRVSS